MKLRSGKTMNNNERKVIVLDIDKTLIHATQNHNNTKCFGDFYICDGKYLVFKRPYVDDFIKYCFETFDKVIVWSSGTSDYVNEVVSKLFKEKYTPFMILTRDHCNKKNGYAKDIHIITRKLRGKGFNKENIYFVEDNPQVVKNLSNNNIIPVSPFITNFRKRGRYYMREKDTTFREIKRMKFN
jgi:TFIIF-interacting CTD phosphatase-like protein